MQNNLIEKQLGHLTLGEAQWIHNLSVYPLLADEDSPPGYLTLDQALNNKQARITEISEGGHVPELAFENLVDQPILLLDGEELVGAKQNRVLNVTLLVLAVEAVVRRKGGEQVILAGVMRADHERSPDCRANSKYLADTITSNA